MHGAGYPSTHVRMLRPELAINTAPEAAPMAPLHKLFAGFDQELGLPLVGVSHSRRLNLTQVLSSAKERDLYVQ